MKHSIDRLAVSSLTPAQLALRYGVSADKVRNWIANGELHAIDVSTRVGGRPQWAIPPEALEQFERTRSTRPAPRPVRRRKRAPPGAIEFF
jgi:transposase